MRKAHILAKSDAPIGLIYLPKKKRGNLNGGFSCLMHVPLSSVVLDLEKIAIECRLFRSQVHLSLI